jgi:glucan 1,3-beta-glucosidase
MLTIIAAALFAPLPKLTVKGPDLVDPSGKRVLLKGCNLGNWFVIEPWMLTLSDKFKDQEELEQILEERLDEEESEELMELYRAGWMGPRDFQIIKSFGMNVVRLPMNYRQFESDKNPFRLKEDAFKWIDIAVTRAEQQGLYTILDMHGAQGGQSEYDHTGKAGQNKLWSVKQNQDRLAWLWGEIAKRYRNRNAVVAYDVFNEPYGGSKPDQVKVFSQSLRSIRENDPDKLVYAMGNYDGFSHYGDPKKNGWRNVGFEMHYYPGLFGGGEPNLMTHAKHLKQLDLVAREVKKLDVPFLVGEMNVVFDSAGGPAMMRRTFDKHASFGWGTTMWSYKVLSEKGGHGNASWAMVTNRDPAPKIDFKTAKEKDIENYMWSLANMPYAINEPLRKALTAKNPKLPPLPKVPDPLVKVPYRDRMQGWFVADLGGALAGGLRVRETGFDLFGAGSDIWARHDSARYLYRPFAGSGTLTVTLTSLADVHAYSKAGLMLRSSLQPNSAAVILTAFPSGELQMAVRPSSGTEMKSVLDPIKASFPIEMRLIKNGPTVSGEWRAGKTAWRKVGQAATSTPLSFAGVVALSHDNRQLVKASYAHLSLR